MTPEQKKALTNVHRALAALEEAFQSDTKVLDLSTLVYDAYIEGFGAGKAGNYPVDTAWFNSDSTARLRKINKPRPD